MALLLYCMTQAGPGVSIPSGVCEAAVQSQDVSELHVYWSDLPDPGACLGTPEALKKAALQFHHVLREVLTVTTCISLRFPTLLENPEALQASLTQDGEQYRAALLRIGDAVQYEIVGSWAADEQADLATPISGREYMKRRQQAELRITAVGSKLQSVTGGSVKEWRQRQERRMHRWYALVPRECGESFVASLRNAGPSEGVKLRLSGPWPPSEFVSPKGEHG